MSNSSRSPEQTTPREAGRELDALIAEKVMGWQRMPGALVMYWDGERARYFDDTADRQQALGVGTGSGLFQPSTDMAAAWLVVERMRRGPTRFANLSLVAYCYNRTYATFDAEAFGDYTPETWAEANGEHATPLAICIAALAAVSSPSSEPR